MCYVTLTIDHRVLDGYQANGRSPSDLVGEVAARRAGAGDDRKHRGHAEPQSYASP
jgi:hypothetical protein